MKFTTTLSLIVGTSLASKAAYKEAAALKSEARNVAMVWTGTTPPPTPDAVCFNEAAYWYNDDSYCW